MFLMAKTAHWLMTGAMVKEDYLIKHKPYISSFYLNKKNQLGIHVECTILKFPIQKKTHKSWTDKNKNA